MTNPPMLEDISRLLLALAAGFGLLNHWFVRLPRTVGLLVIAFVASMGLIGRAAR